MSPDDTEAEAPIPIESPAAEPSTPQPVPVPVPPPTPVPIPADDEPLSLVEEFDSTGPSKRTTLGGSATRGPVHKTDFLRPLNVTGTGATRCRVFSSKIAGPALEHMEMSINDWLDGDEIEVKHVGHVIGTMEGKRPEPNVIVLVWY